MVDWQIDRLSGTRFENLQSVAREAFDRSVGVVPTQGVPRLVHDDFRPANILFDQAGEAPITAVLDWQFALAAHPEYHIARTDFLSIDPAFQDADRRRTLRERLYAGYREHRPVYHFATLLWRVSGFETAFADHSELARARAEARFRQQFDRLTERLPTA